MTRGQMFQTPHRKVHKLHPTNCPDWPSFDVNQDEGALTFPDKLKGDPSKRSRDKYYHFHRDHIHDTFDYDNLKQ